MNWRQALHSFYSSFGIPAYPEASVPEKVAFPWLTYSTSRNDFGMDTSIQLHLHYYTESESTPNAKADTICNAIRDGKVINCDEGKLVLYTGSPEWIDTADQRDRMHKHRIINVTITWLLTS